MHVVELKRDPEAGVEFSEEDDVAKRMPRLLREEGILARAGAAINLAPPLVINGEEVDEVGRWHRPRRHAAGGGPRDRVTGPRKEWIRIRCYGSPTRR